MSVEVAPSQPAPRLLNQVRSQILTPHDSIRTAATYMDWVRLYLMRFRRIFQRNRSA
jgi:hypothetical protein